MPALKEKGTKHLIDHVKKLFSEFSPEGFVTKEQMVDYAQPIGDYALATESGYDLGLSIDTSTYVMTLQLKDKNGAVLSSKTIDFPIESMVVNATYSSGIITLTLQNGTTLDVDVSALVSGLVKDTFTIAGIDMKDNITADELITALGINNKVDKTTVNNIIDGTTTVGKAKTSNSATKSTQDGNGNVITDTYATKTELKAYPQCEQAFVNIGNTQDGINAYANVILQKFNDHICNLVLQGKVELLENYNSSYWTPFNFKVLREAFGLASLSFATHKTTYTPIGKSSSNHSDDVFGYGMAIHIPNSSYLDLIQAGRYYTQNGDFGTWQNSTHLSNGLHFEIRIFDATYSK